MKYIAENVDSEKALTAIDDMDKLQARRKSIELARVEGYNAGFNDALNDCRGIFKCDNYEKEDEGQ